MDDTFKWTIDIVHVPSLYYLMTASCGQSALLKSIFSKTFEEGFRL